MAPRCHQAPPAPELAPEPAPTPAAQPAQPAQPAPDRAEQERLEEPWVQSGPKLIWPKESDKM